MDEKEPEQIIKGFKIQGHPDRKIPKICNSVLFGKLQNDQILLTFLFQEPMTEEQAKQVGDMVDASLIERIIVDKQHAEKIIKALQDIIKGKEQKNA